MTPRRINILKWTFIVVSSLIFLVFVTGELLSRYATTKIQAALALANGQVGELDVNLFQSRIIINDFEIAPNSDGEPKLNHARIKTVTLKDISIYQFLVNKKIRIGTLQIADGNIRINKNISLKSLPKKESAIKGINIDHFILKNLQTTITDDTVLRYSGVLSTNIDDIQSPDGSGIADIHSYTLKNAEATVSKIIINDSAGLYQTKISRLYANSSKEILQLDSLILVPQHPKVKFAKVAGKQIDRINMFIHKVLLTGVQYNLLRDSSFVASTMDIISGEVVSFRDKRMPFREKKIKPLPMEALQQLKFGIELDTIRIIDSKVIYEEFPPEGFKSGKVTFESLNATMTNVSNRMYYNKPKYATLHASAKLMGKGLIQASFHLPLDDSPYHAEGKISGMTLSHLNPVLESLAFISIESGRLNEINFDFDYTDKSSTGRLTINYENLKINGLKKEKETIINDLKTLLINTVIKNDKDKNTPTEKRAGTIAFERDRKRQIFNYWWKSLFSGIKESVLEK